MQATGSAFHYNRVQYNKPLTNLACSSRTGEYWPLVVFVRTSLPSVSTATTSGQYSPVRPSRSVSKRLIIHKKKLLYSDWLSAMQLKCNKARKIVNQCKKCNTTANRPFPNYLLPLFQSESWCSSFHMKISFHSHAYEN